MNWPLLLKSSGFGLTIGRSGEPCLDAVGFRPPSSPSKWDLDGPSSGPTQKLWLLLAKHKTPLSQTMRAGADSCGNMLCLFRVASFCIPARLYLLCRTRHVWPDGAAFLCSAPYSCQSGSRCEGFGSGCHQCSYKQRCCLASEKDSNHPK
jgi:hypothetical protein